MKSGRSLTAEQRSAAGYLIFTNYLYGMGREAGCLHLPYCRAGSCGNSSEGYWFLYLRTGYDDALIPRIVAFLPEVLGCSLMEYLIFACNFETFDIFKAVVGSVGVVEMHLYSITYNLHLLEGHALAEESLHAIGLAECLECKTFAYRLFLTWMNLLNLVWVNQVFGTDDAAVWNHLAALNCCSRSLGPQSPFTSPL